MHDFSHEPSRLPAPIGLHTEMEVRRTIKLLGISPSIINGIRGFRVIWRPFLEEPVRYTAKDGTTGVKRKADEVKTRWFPIVEGTTECQAFVDASRLACRVYKTKPPAARPKIEWERVATAQGVKIRGSYAKPALNGAMDRAAALFVQGYSPRQVAERIGVDRSTASRWRKKLGTQ